jgi:hypothetical protein
MLRLLIEMNRYGSYRANHCSLTALIKLRCMVPGVPGADQGRQGQGPEGEGSGAHAHQGAAYHHPQDALR